MRFNLDEALDATTDEEVPTNLESLPSDDDDEELKLDDDFLTMLSNLNLKTRLPQWDMHHRGHYYRRPLSSASSTRATGKIDTEEQRDAFDVKSLGVALQDSINDKLEKQLLINMEQINNIKEKKRRILEEQKRREAEEAKKREQEQERIRLQKIKEEQLAKEKLAQEKQKALELAAQQKAKEEQELKAKKAAEEQERQARETAAKQNQSMTDFAAIDKLFWSYKEKIASIKKDIVQPVKDSDKDLRNTISRHKRKINPKFGQLTNSNQQLMNIKADLIQLIDQTKANSLAYQWILNFIAKAAVHQAETEVRVKPESALPLGKLILSLLITYPELKDLLMARFVKKCPYVIGFTCKIDTEKGRINMGWKRNSEDKWEDESSYSERMGGMMTLFSVLTRLPLPQEFITSHSHPLPITKSWQMLARICNTSLDLLTNTHFIVIGNWWDASAAEFLQAYANQGAKLLQLLGDDLTNVVAEHKYSGAARLRILMEEWQMGQLKSFPEMEA
ncbi:hypothetical protein NCAS_0C02570 [Naumovozyma castellii]|uniref:mRNA export factor GLE1 n=1 Tax=Naumovozyma castellii TaxID=27288 RepID=G0VCN7_NAUCA|nr:hypothetical protein NCAS_0C02570 [Naumovozyma castellii CBS 4309]CCC69247.1 hypothetical protein NCAS_0C02570 [Naumovozyma castellii CBS 4309]